MKWKSYADLTQDFRGNFVTLTANKNQIYILDYFFALFYMTLNFNICLKGKLSKLITQFENSEDSEKCLKESTDTLQSTGRGKESDLSEAIDESTFWSTMSSLIYLISGS